MKSGKGQFSSNHSLLLPVKKLSLQIPNELPLVSFCSELVICCSIFYFTWSTTPKLSTKTAVFYSQTVWIRNCDGALLHDIWCLILGDCLGRGWFEDLQTHLEESSLTCMTSVLGSPKAWVQPGVLTSAPTHILSLWLGLPYSMVEKSQEETFRSGVSGESNGCCMISEATYYHYLHVLLVESVTTPQIHKGRNINSTTQQEACQGIWTHILNQPLNQF